MPEIRDIRRQIADPENEPDFYEISQRFPVSPSAKKMQKSAGGGGGVPSALTTTATATTMNAMNLTLSTASSMTIHEEPLFKRQRLLMDFSLPPPPPMIVPSRPSAVSMALAMARPPPLHPQEARLQFLRLLQEQQQRKELLLTSLLLRQRHLR